MVAAIAPRLDSHITAAKKEPAILHAQAQSFVDKANTTPTISDPIFSKHL
jgi:hypothetical protein